MREAKLKNDEDREDVEDEADRKKKAQELLITSKHHEEENDRDNSLEDYRLVRCVILGVDLGKLADEELVSCKRKEESWHGDNATCGRAKKRDEDAEGEYLD